ncbi:MAG: sigma-70 family RNA polymerase sigma factor [Acidobacteriales bacterium]|nr:sigma-70 family RNA polymerase sigma factor [Terriglobales bacterium]
MSLESPLSTPPNHAVTLLLKAWSGGDEHALEKLTPLVYRQLHQIAQRYMGGERPGHTLQPTALVNEAYLRLVGYSEVKWQDRAHFFAVSANLMRRILIDFARSRGSLKRGGDVDHMTLDREPLRSEGPDLNLVALDDALRALAALDARKSKIVELKFFGGLSIEETAEVMGVSTDTVMRDWRVAKLWLLRELSHESGSDEA